MHNDSFTHEHLAELLGALSGHYHSNLCDGRVRSVARDLPGAAVAVVCPPVNGVILVICDLRKPDAMAHLRDLLREWWTSCSEPILFPDGTIELSARALPLVDHRPKHVSMVAWA